MEDPIPPLKLHLFAARNPSAWLTIKLLFPGRSMEPTVLQEVHGGSHVQYLAVISYDAPERKKRWSQKRMTRRRKIGPTTTYKQSIWPSRGPGQPSLNFKQEVLEGQRQKKVHQEAQEWWNLKCPIVELSIKRKTEGKHWSFHR